MRRLRTTPTRRLYAIVAAVLALAAGGGIAQAALGGSGSPPDPKPLDRAVHDALTAPAVAGVSARIEFTNGLFPAGSLPNGEGSPLAEGAEGRLWLARDGRFRVELQSDAGDAQIASDGERVMLFDSTSDTAYTMPAPEQRERQESEPPTLAGVRGALERLAETWSLSGAQPTTTAGRPSYTLRIAPRDDGGLLGAAEVAWDAANGVPLRAGIYAQGQDEPVLELEATDVSFEPVSDAEVSAKAPAGARVVEIDPPHGAGSGGKPGEARGIDAVARELDFPLAAPAELAGLPRRAVRLVDADGRPGALTVYGEGLGAIMVFQHRAGEEDEELPLELPRVNIDGATGTELATPLGTLVSFRRDGVAYVVVGSVPPVAAENAARGLR